MGDSPFPFSAKAAPSRPDEPSLTLAAFSFLVAAGAYLFTMAPSIYPGDSPEFTAAAHVLGIPHPPGYAHYVFLGNLAVRLIPFGNVAFRLNLLSVIGAAMTAALVSLLIFRWTARFVPALAGGLLLAFSKDFWAQSGSAEVYTVLPLFLILLIHISLGGSIFRTDDGEAASSTPRFVLCMASFVWGYATGIHYFILFALPGGLLLLGGRYGWKTVGRSLGVMTLCAAAGWSLFLLIPVRSIVSPPLNWGETFRPDNFLKHIFWSTYTKRPVQGFSWIQAASRTMDFVLLCARQWPIPVLILIPPGILWLFRNRSMAESLSLVALAVIPAAAAIFLLNDPSREQFFGNDSNKFLFVFPILACMAGLGLAQAEEWADRLGPRIPRYPALFAAVVVSILGAGCVVMTVHGNRQAADRSSSLALHAYTLNLVEALPEGSGLAVEGDIPTFPLLYLRYVEEDRPDLSVYGRFGILFSTDYNAADQGKDGVARERIRLQIDNALVRRHTGRMFYSIQVEDYAPSLDHLPRVWGLVYAADNDARNDAVPPPDLLGIRFLRDPILRREVQADLRTRELAAETYLMAGFQRVAAGRREEAKILVEKALEAAPDHYWTDFRAGVLRYTVWNDIAGAGKLLEKASTILPNEFVFNALGAIRFRSGDLDGAEADFRKALEMKKAFLASSMNLAEIRIARGMYAQALEILDEASRRHPEVPNVWSRRGQVQGFLGRFDAAVRSFDQAVELAPGDAESYYLRAVAEAAAGKLEASVSDARRAVALSPGYPAYAGFLSKVSKR